MPVPIKDRKFPERQLADRRCVPAAQGARDPRPRCSKPVPADLKQGYLTVNRDVRRESEERLRAITAQLRRPSAVDRRLPSPVERRADERLRRPPLLPVRGEVIDQQTHLGYDLASLKNAPVEATQDGVVVFADYLGIYGNTVVLDHGLGVFSLYGHLSTIGVQVGQQVQAGDTLGQTGETGLAGGDHLHFSIMLRGVHVDPVEWWDPLWMRDHVADAPAAACRAAQPARPPRTAPPAGVGAARRGDAAMAKPSPDALQDAGERLLARVGHRPPTRRRRAGGGAASRGRGRRRHRAPTRRASPAPRAPQLLQRLERESADKRVRKEAKRALYRLRAARRARCPSRRREPAPAPADRAAARGLRVAGRRARRSARLAAQAAARRRRASVRGDQRSRRAARGGAERR